MRFDFALLADYAQVVDGKLNVQGGGLTRLVAPALPWMQPLAITMRLEPDEDDDLTREWQFRVSVVGPGDDVLVEHQTPISLNRPDITVAEGENPGVLLALTMNNLVIGQYGPHHVRLAFDGAETDLPFAVVGTGT